MVKKIEIGKKLIIQIIILIAVAWIISLVVTEIFNLKLKDFKLPQVFQPNIVVKIYKDNKKKNTFRIKNVKEDFVSSKKKKKYIQKIKNPFKDNKKKKMENFQIEEFTTKQNKKFNCSIGNKYEKMYNSGMDKLNKNKVKDFIAYNNEDSGYTQTFIK